MLFLLLVCFALFWFVGFYCILFLFYCFINPVCSVMRETQGMDLGGWEDTWDFSPSGCTEWHWFHPEFLSQTEPLNLIKTEISQNFGQIAVRRSFWLDPNKVSVSHSLCCFPWQGHYYVYIHRISEGNNKQQRAAKPPKLCAVRILIYSHLVFRSLLTS